MILDLSPEKQKFFLLAFTQELILNSNKPSILDLKEVIEQKVIPREKEEIKVEKKDETKNILPKKEIKVGIKEEGEGLVKINPLKKVTITIKEVDSENKNLTSIKPLNPRKIITKVINPQNEIIPEPTLPPHLAYLKPIPSNKNNIDLFELNPFLLDPAVKVITANPNEKVIVSGLMGTRLTALFLTKEDIDKIITQVSRISKIPLREGIYHVVIGNINFSAIISSVIGSKFVIKKMDYSDYISSEIKR